MLGHIRSQRTAKLQIFTCWSLFAPTVGAIRGERRRVFILLVIRWPTFPLSSVWRARAIRFALARWSFPCSHLLGCGLLPSLCHSRPSSSGVWTSSPTSSAYSASARRRSSRRPLEEERPPPDPCNTLKFEFVEIELK